MNLHNMRLEFKALRTICDSKNTTAKTKLLTALKKDHFFDETAKTIFKRIKSVLKNKGYVVSWYDIEHSTKIPEDMRKEIIAYTDIKPARTTDSIENLYASLEEYRKSRALLDISEVITEGLRGKTLDVDKLYNDVNNNLNDNRFASNNIVVHTISKPNSAKELVHKIIFGDKSRNVIPTGMNKFDEENGGFPKEGLVVIAANSGGGKSAMMVQISKNMALLGFKSYVIPLEMNEEELMARYMANVAQIDVRKFTGAQKITKSEQQKAAKAWRKFEQLIEKAKGWFKIHAPEEDIDITSALTLGLVEDPDVMWIDYIGLLEDADGDDQWRILGRIARYSKRFASKYHKLVILLAQLSDEGQIRYSRAIKEHANNMLAWTVTDDNINSGEILIKQQKARNQKAFDFPLRIDFAHMTMDDEPAGESETIRRIKNKLKNNKKLKGNKRTSKNGKRVHNDKKRFKFVSVK